MANKLNVDLIYPIGSIYMSVNNTNPSILFGGTWESWGAGRVPVGVDTTQSEFDTVEETGGEKTHTLTVEEIPPHSHQSTSQGSNHTSNYYMAVTQYGENTMTTRNTGGGQAHNNLQPYITCYMWKRIS